MEASDHLRHIGDKRILEDLGGHSELLYLLFHLVEVHMFIELSKLVEEQGHSVIVSDISCHKLLELLVSFLLLSFCYHSMYPFLVI